MISFAVQLYLFIPVRSIIQSIESTYVHISNQVETPYGTMWLDGFHYENEKNLIRFLFIHIVSTTSSSP